ncbi:phytanoyl-CoA dioxygenase family protein [Luminiphilus sp.]|nr:phytanoyl-CoA dioxygenase family protein [Luminiphilus sp.]
MQIKRKFFMDNEKTDFFHENGYIVLENYFDIESEIRPIQRAIYEIVGLIMRRRSLHIEREDFNGDNFDSGFLKLLQKDREFGREMYDQAKQIPEFLRLICSQKSEDLFKSIRSTDLSGIGAASYGIRIDNPGEEEFRSQWHQEFTFQPQSKDGIVFWTPLLPITQQLGPVQICPKSHQDGLRKFARGGDYAEKAGAYQMGLENEAEVISGYDVVSPLTKPGDLLLMDFCTIHQSGFNVGARARWSIQHRFFNFREATGIKLGWKGSVTSGVSIEDTFKDYFKE